MKITKRQLARIIKEELQRVISEHPDPWREFDDLDSPDDDEVSICCGAQRYGEHDICGECGEHTDFEPEGAWQRGEYEST